jgi:hypothetical protein
MVIRATARRWVAAVLVAALLAVSSPARADDTGEPGKISSWQYIGRGALVVGAAVIVFIIVRAALSKPDETSRLAAATAKLDRALAPPPVTAAARAPAARAPARDLGPRRTTSRLAADLVLAAPTRPGQP